VGRKESVKGNELRADDLFRFSFPSLRFVCCSYQFNPLLLNPDVIVQLLLKALLATPGPDFGLAMAIIGDRAVSFEL